MLLLVLASVNADTASSEADAEPVVPAVGSEGSGTDAAATCSEELTATGGMYEIDCVRYQARLDAAMSVSTIAKKYFFISCSGLAIRVCLKIGLIDESTLETRRDIYPSTSSG